MAFVAYSRHMISTKNPFPGMNPYLESYWADVHTTLIGSIREALVPSLPADLNARTEERVLVDDSDFPRSYRADVAVSETWKQGIAPAWSPEDQGKAVTVAEPEYVHIEFLNERWIEIRTAHGKLVTAIEVLAWPISAAMRINATVTSKAIIWLPMSTWSRLICCGQVNTRSVCQEQESPPPRA